MGRWGDGISRLSRLSLALALPKQHFSYTRNPGARFWGRKKPLREWGHALPRFSSPNRCFWLRTNPGACFWGRKKPLREWGHALPRFPHKIAVFSYGKTLGPVWGGIKSPCGNGDTHSLVLGKYWSRTRCLRGASSACQPTGQSDDGGPSACQTTGQSDDGGPSGQGIPRSEPSFSDTKTTFLISFSTTEKRVF